MKQKNTHTHYSSVQSEERPKLPALHPTLALPPPALSVSGYSIILRILNFFKNSSIYVSSYDYMCVLIPLYMCPHTTISVGPVVPDVTLRIVYVYYMFILWQNRKKDRNTHTYTRAHTQTISEYKSIYINMSPRSNAAGTE